MRNRGRVIDWSAIGTSLTHPFPKTGYYPKSRSCRKVYNGIMVWDINAVSWTAFTIHAPPIPQPMQHGLKTEWADRKGKWQRGSPDLRPSRNEETFSQSRGETEMEKWQENQQAGTNWRKCMSLVRQPSKNRLRGSHMRTKFDRRRRQRSSEQTAEITAEN